MRVIYIGAFRLPNFDAAAPRVLNNAKAMRDAGCNLTFISWGGKYRDEDLCEDGFYRVDGFRYIISDDLLSQGTFFQKLKAKSFRGWKSFKILKTLAKPDLIVLYNSNQSFTTRILKYCEKNSIKLANDITEWYDNNELHLLDILPNYFNMTRTQFRVKNKIVISSYLNEFYKDSNNILVPPLCDKDEPKWNACVEDERIKPFDGISLIYAGTPAKKDCVHTVINAVNTLAEEGKPIRFIILGISREQYSKGYSHFLLNKNLHKNIIFLGRVSQESIPAYYKMADFMVLLREPNRKNMAGFPTKFAESITAGVPVITNATSDLANYVTTGKTGFLVDSPEYSDLLNLLRNKVLILNDLDIENLKTNTSKLSQEFDWHFYKDGFKRFLENLK